MTPTDEFTSESETASILADPDTMAALAEAEAETPAPPTVRHMSAAHAWDCGWDAGFNAGRTFSVPE